ncbi:galE, partial [Symbiodinium microadriaticum]
FFNPIGAHPSGKIGEDPNGPPNNLTPFVAQVAVGKREKLTVFGADYPTPDGTGVRDYVHVMDMAEGHVAALRCVCESHAPGYYVFNLGSGRGVSVLEMVRAVEQACGYTIPYEVGPRREGDTAVCYADTSKAKNELGWEATRSLDEACADLWRWQSSNPNGYS